MSDLNVVCLIGRRPSLKAPKNAELGIAGNDTPYCAFSIAARRSRQVDGEWTETPHYFDFRLSVKSGRASGNAFTRAAWFLSRAVLNRTHGNQNGKKRSSLKIAVERMRLLGKAEQTGQEPDDLSDLSPSGNPEALENGREGT